MDSVYLFNPERINVRDFVYFYIIYRDMTKVLPLLIDPIVASETIDTPIATQSCDRVCNDVHWLL